MASGAFRPASSDEVSRLERSLVAAKTFVDRDEMRAVHRAEPWRIRVNGAGDVLVVERWRDHQPYLAIAALWCPPSTVAGAVGQLRSVATEMGYTDVLSPPVRLEEAYAYERAGMRIHTVVAALTIDDLRPRRARPAPEGVSIRDAEAGEVDVLLSVDARCFMPMWHYDRRHLVRFFATGRLAVAVREGSAVGYTLTTVDGRHGMLGRLCVTGQCRRQGIGAALLAEAMEYAHVKGARQMTLSTQTDNLPSQALYWQAGFADGGRRYAFLRFGGDEEIA